MPASTLFLAGILLKPQNGTFEPGMMDFERLNPTKYLFPNRGNFSVMKITNDNGENFTAQKRAKSIKFSTLLTPLNRHENCPIFGVQNV
jgi:hypothetical protein